MEVYADKTTVPPQTSCLGDRYTWRGRESDGRETRSDWWMGGLENKCPLINLHYTVLQSTPENEAYFKIHSPH